MGLMNNIHQAFLFHQDHWIFEIVFNINPVKYHYTSLAILLVAFLSAVEGYSQAINTDRPTQSASAFVLPQGRLQLETGILFQETNDFTNEWTINNSLLRYGLNDFFELRLTLDYGRRTVAADAPGFPGSGFRPVIIGFKSRLVDEKGFIPQISFLGQIALPSGEDPFRLRTTVPGFRFNFQNSFAGGSSLGYNWGMEWSEGISETTNVYTLIYNYPLSGEFTVFLELYGFITETNDDHRMDTGFTYLLNDKLQLDLSGGFGLSEISPDWFLSGGVSFAFIK